MRNHLIICLILVLNLTSCSHEEETNTTLFQTWVAKDFMSLESVAYPKNENTKILLTFSKSGTYSLKLDINTCSGNFTASKVEEISMESPACTKACCDSRFSEKLAIMLPKVKTYKIDGNILRLEVPEWGFIKLELASN